MASTAKPISIQVHNSGLLLTIIDGYNFNAIQNQKNKPLNYRSMYEITLHVLPKFLTLYSLVILCFTFIHGTHYTLIYNIIYIPIQLTIKIAFNSPSYWTIDIYIMSNDYITMLMLMFIYIYIYYISGSQTFYLYHSL